MPNIKVYSFFACQYINPTVNLQLLSKVNRAKHRNGVALTIMQWVAIDGG